MIILEEKKHTSYLVLGKVAARIFLVPATNVAVERELSFAGNIATKKCVKLSPEIVNDVVFNHPLTKYKQR